MNSLQYPNFPIQQATKPINFLGMAYSIKQQNTLNKGLVLILMKITNQADVE